MAIAKTSPAPIMTAGDYKDAALRHFNTCKVLWRYVSIPDASNLKNIDETIILKNVFYLSGYVVECALKYYHSTTHHNLQDFHNEQHWKSRGIEMRKHFAFTNHPKNSNNPSNDKDWSMLILSQLEGLNSAILPNHFKKLGMPTTTLTLSPLEDILHDMQESWEPSIRYHFETNGLIANKAQIEAFYQSTKNLLRNLSMI